MNYVSSLPIDTDNRRPSVGPRPRDPSSEVAPTHRTRSEADTIITRHQDALWRYLRHLGCDPELAADLAQDAFVVLLGKSAGLPQSRQFAFLRSAARNLWRNWLRKQRLQPKRADWADDVDRVWADVNEPDERLLRLRHCMGGLAPKAREGIRLFYDQGLTRAATARQLRMSLDGAKSLLRRARNALAECINASNGGAQ